jgi:hypothetical protein
LVSACKDNNIERIKKIINLNKDYLDINDIIEKTVCIGNFYILKYFYDLSSECSKYIQVYFEKSLKSNNLELMTFLSSKIKSDFIVEDNLILKADYPEINKYVDE